MPKKLDIAEKLRVHSKIGTGTLLTPTQTKHLAEMVAEAQGWMEQAKKNQSEAHADWHEAILTHKRALKVLTKAQWHSAVGIAGAVVMLVAIWWLP